MATPLAEKIKSLISANGPISITDYFALCLADPNTATIAPAIRSAVQAISSRRPRSASSSARCSASS